MRELLLVITNQPARGYQRGFEKGYNRESIRIINGVEKIRGYKDQWAIYAGEPYLMDDFGEILDYMVSHNIKVIKEESKNDFQAPTQSDNSKQGDKL